MAGRQYPKVKFPAENAIFIHDIALWHTAGRGENSLPCVTKKSLSSRTRRIAAVRSSMATFCRTEWRADPSGGRNLPKKPVGSESSCEERSHELQWAGKRCRRCNEQPESENHYLGRRPEAFSRRPAQQWRNSHERRFLLPSFFGDATGGGTYIGIATVNFEGELKPGYSPAAVSFSGHVAFGPEATLTMDFVVLLPDRNSITRCCQPSRSRRRPGNFTDRRLRTRCW
jgi:hypothetical protein